MLCCTVIALTCVDAASRCAHCENYDTGLVRVGLRKNTGYDAPAMCRGCLRRTYRGKHRRSCCLGAHSRTRTAAWGSRGAEATRRAFGRPDTFSGHAHVVAARDWKVARDWARPLVRVVLCGQLALLVRGGPLKHGHDRASDRAVEMIHCEVAAREHGIRCRRLLCAHAHARAAAVHAHAPHPGQVAVGRGNAPVQSAVRHVTARAAQ